MGRISVIMSTGGNRLTILENVLTSWSKVTHPDFDFTLIDNGNTSSGEVERLAGKFPHITKFITYDKAVIPNKVWVDEGKKTEGKYLIYAMSDEILGSYDILEQMEKVETDRASVLTYYLNEAENELLPTINWLDEPKLIEGLSDFWEHQVVDNEKNRWRTNAELTTHLTGATRKYWEWLGWHRDDEFGYLNLDTDIVLRERFLNKHPVTIGCCYHQWHPRASIPEEHRLPAYVYHTEEQARLLAPTTRGD